MKFRTLAMAALACAYILLQAAFAQDSWTTVAPLPDSRWLLAAATAGDGKIYAIAGNVGGPDFYGTTETVLAYDPSADTWQQVASLSSPRQNLAAAADLSGRIYAIGGYLHGFPFFRSTVECFDPQLGYWVRRAEMPTARQGLAAASDASGLIYALGGSFTFSAPTNLVEVYDPVADAWFTGTAMLSPREGFAATTGRDGRIYVLGGYDGNAYLQSAEVYDPAAHIWTAIAPMQSVRYGLAAATGSDGRIYAIGGYAGSDLSSVEAYDPATDSWTYVASMSVPREGHAVTAAPDGRIFAIAGPGNTVEAYTPALIFPDKPELSISIVNRPPPTTSPADGTPKSKSEASDSNPHAQSRDSHGDSH